MAEFNPQLRPTQDPNYDRISQPSRVPSPIEPKGVAANTILPHGVEQGDQSAAFAGRAAAAGMEADAQGSKTYSDLFAGIVDTGNFMAKAGVNMVTKSIEDQVYQTASDIRSAYTAQLEKAKQGAGGVNSLLESNASANRPPELDSLPDTLDSLVSARDSGKISGTYYQGALLAAAKDFRTRYPGFRDEIDQKFAAVTGTNPANAYVTSLVGDINAAVGNKERERLRTEKFIEDRLGYPNAVDKLKAFKRGDITDIEVREWAAPHDKETADLTLAAARMNDKKLNREDRAYNVSRGTDKALSIVANRTVDSLMGQFGMNSAADASALNSKFKAGAISSDRFTEIGNAVGMHMQEMRITMLRDLDQKGITELLGGKEKAIERVNAALEPFKALNDAVYSHDFGGIYFAAQHIKAQTDEDLKRLRADSIMGPFTRQVAVQRANGGDQWVQQANLDALMQDIPTKYKDYYVDMTREMQTQTNHNDTGAPIVTLNRIFDEFEKKDINDPKVSAGVINEITKIANPDVPKNIRVNYALTAFSPEAGKRSFVERLNADGVDSQGRQIQGQNAVFQKFTSAEMTKQMAILGKENPQIWENYSNWTKETLANVLVPKEIKDLSQIRNPAIKVGWDSDNKRFVASYQGQDIVTGMHMGLTRGGKTTDQAGGTDPEYGIVQRSITRLNSNLGNFKNVAEASGQNVDAFILKTISDSAPDALKNVQGIPYQIMRQIGLAQLKR